MEFHSFQNEKILNTDEAYQIFLNPRQPILIKDILKVKVAQRLTKMGLFQLSKHQTVVCRSADDFRGLGEPDEECDQIIEIHKKHVPYSEGDLIICERCGHEFFLSESHRKITSFYSLQPNDDAILQLFEARMTEQNLPWQKLARGCYCLLQGIPPLVLVVTDFVSNVSLKEQSIFFKFEVSYGNQPFFDLADFLCERRKFLEVLTPVKNTKPPQTKPQLILDFDGATFSGQKIASIQYRNQWNVFHFLLTHPDKTFSLEQLADELEKKENVIADPEGQIRRPLNKIREKTEKMGLTKNYLLEHRNSGYCFHSDAVEIIEIPCRKDCKTSL